MACLCGRLHRVGDGFLGLDRDDVAKALQPPVEVCGGSGLVDLIEVSLAEVVIPNAARQHVVGRHQDFVRDGNLGTFGRRVAL